MLGHELRRDPGPSNDLPTKRRPVGISLAWSNRQMHALGSATATLHVGSGRHSSQALSGCSLSHGVGGDADCPGPSVGLKPVIQIPRKPPEANEIPKIAEIQRKETKNRNPGGICPHYRSPAGAVFCANNVQSIRFIANYSYVSNQT